MIVMDVGIVSYGVYIPKLIIDSLIYLVGAITALTSGMAVAFLYERMKKAV